MEHGAPHGVTAVALPVAFMAGVTLYAAVYHVLLHLRAKERSPRDLHFGLLAALVGLYDVCCVGLYVSADVEQGACWQRLQLAVLPLVGFSIIYFVDAYTETRGPGWARRGSLLLVGLALAALAERRGLLLSDQPAVKHIHLNWFGEVVYYEKAAGPLFYAIFSGVAYVLAYTLAVSRRARRAGKHARANGILLGVLVFLGGLTHDGLMAAGIVESIYLIEYAFTGMLALISFTLSSEVVQAAEAKQALAEREMALAHAQRLESIGRLAGGVAHDLNNMLTPVLSYIQLALRRIPENSLEYSYLEASVAAASRAAALTQKLLALGRKQVLKVRPIDIGQSLRELSPLMQHLLPPQVRLDIQVMDGLPAVEADAGQLDQVWMNLTANARDAMPHGGTLTFRVSSDPTKDRVVVTVTDTGVGMSRTTAEHIFEPFFTTKERGKGTGLGLSIVRGIVEQHGGRIEVRSKLGEGTTFSLLFPATAAPLVEAPAPQRPAPQIAAAEGRVLVVDDDETIRRLVQEILQQHGFEVHAAGSRAELEALLPSLSALQLLIADVLLPDTDGPQVRAMVAARFPRTPCMFITGHADEVLAPRGMLRGDIELLRKPFTADQLLGRVQALLHGATSAVEPLRESPSL